MSRFRYQRRGKRGTGKTGLRIKKSVKPSGSNMAKLVKSVNQIKRRVSGAEKTLYYRFKVNSTAPSGTNYSSELRTPYNMYHLCNYNTMVVGSGNAIFGSSATALDIKADRCRHEAITMDLYVSLENMLGTNSSEWNTVNFTCFLVSLKDAIGSKFNASTGAVTLTGGDDYTTVGTVASVDGGYAYINPKIFKVHKSKRFTLSNFNQSPQTLGLTNPPLAKQWQWKIYPNQTVVNSVGSWTDLACAPDPSKNYYVIIFNNNSGIDAENPTCLINCVSRIKTV